MNKQKQTPAEQKKVYDELSKQYSAEELAQYFVFPSLLTEGYKSKVSLKYKELRMERLRNMSEKEVMFNGLLRMKYRIEDYFSEQSYEEEFSFSNQLKQYLKITHRTQAEMCDEINIEKTKLSKLINGKIKPSIEICLRLQKHSDEILSAKYWFKLYLRGLETVFEHDTPLRKNEYGKVKSTLSLGMTG